jgi:hypothetical protein
MSIGDDKKIELPAITLPLESTMFIVKASWNKGCEEKVSTTKS